MHYNFPHKTIIDLFREQKINYFGLSEITDFSIESMYLKDSEERRKCIHYLSSRLIEPYIGTLISGMPKNGRIYLQIEPHNEEKPYWLEIGSAKIHPQALDDYNTTGTPFYFDEPMDTML